MRILILLLTTKIFLLISCSSNELRKNDISIKNECISVDIKKNTDNTSSKIGLSEQSDESHKVLTVRSKNTFSPDTTLFFDLKKDSDFSIEFYNAIGKQIRAPYRTNLNKGNYIAEFKNVELQAGLYYVKLSVNNEKGVTCKILFTN